MKKIKLSDVILKTGATLTLSEIDTRSREDILQLEVKNVAPLNLAEVGQLSFLTNPKYKDQLFVTKATAVFTPEVIPNCPVPQLVHKNPYAAMASVAQELYQLSHSFQGRSPLAFVESGAVVDAEASLYPFCYISSGANIGRDSVIYPHCFIGRDAQVGQRTILYPGVVVMDRCTIGDDVIIHGNTVIGADGFGFSPSQDGIIKIPQMGTVNIAANVEIGASSTVDRATFESTTIGFNSKLDSQVHVGHNVRVGQQTMLCAQSGIAGSATIGDHVIMAGQSGVAPSIHVGDGVVLGARCAAIGDIKDPGEYLGMPSIPSREWAKQKVLLKKLPELYKRIQELEKKLEKLQTS